MKDQKNQNKGTIERGLEEQGNRADREESDFKGS